MRPRLAFGLRVAVAVFWTLAALAAASRLGLLLWVAGPHAVATALGFGAGPAIPEARWTVFGGLAVIALAVGLVVGLLRRRRFARPLGLVLGALTLLWALLLVVGAVFLTNRVPSSLAVAATLFAAAGLATMAAARGVAVVPVGVRTPTA